ncbi:TlpA disulfide reductase family protein [Aeromicrobium sp. 9AM]|uniref:TlpA family protein disulfide reductase n=1 Tax=Aeromicrobium sp. 9AM TaxID=2653126 RepID=UPI00135C2F3A|nr:TlpA disulfide reductase family protein [Aeromicrobium sp. 9AM]
MAVGALVLVAACTGGRDRTTDGYVGADGSKNELVTVVPVGDRKPAPKLEGEGLDGKPLSIADFAGKTIVINLWGPWCPPCRAEAPALKEVSSEYADKDVQFIGMLTRTPDSSSAIAFNRKKGLTYPSFADDGGRLELEFVDSLPTTAIPTTWVIDAKGRVAARIMDPKLRASTLAGVIDDVQKSTS